MVAAAADDARRVHVFWEDSRSSDYEIYHPYFDGAQWSVEERLTTDSASSRELCLAADAGGKRSSPGATSGSTFTAR